MKQVFILFAKSLMMGIEPHWRILSADKKTALKTNMQFEESPKGEYVEIDTFSDVKKFCKENKFKIAGASQITYSLANKTMTVYIDNAADCTYSDVRSDRQAQNILREDYGSL